MSEDRRPFDGLARDYDQARPRYPEEAFRTLVSLLPNRALAVADAGAGTGIALEGLLPLLPQGSAVDAIDISADMVAIGKEKFPQVSWSVAPVEEWLARRDQLDLVVAAQAYQWMDRNAFVENAGSALRDRHGVLAVIQNNRNYSIPGLAADYEDILEEFSPGYRRDYRAIDIASETSVVAAEQMQYRFEWIDTMSSTSFEMMSRSSTQAQRAIKATGGEFIQKVRSLAQAFEQQGQVQLNYVTELFVTRVR